MKRSRISFLLIAVLYPALVSAQWQPTNGPCGGTVYSLLARNGNLFAGTSGTVFLSTNGAASWTNVRKGLPRTAVFALVSVVEAVFAACGKDGVFRSTDNGTNWIAVNNGLAGQEVVSLAADGTSLFAGASGTVFRSLNSGGTWSEVSNGLPQYLSRVHALLVARRSPIGTDVFAATSLGVFCSSDSGDHWAPTGMADREVFALASQDSLLFAATQQHIMISSNGGVNWTAGNPIGTDGHISSLAMRGTSLFAGSAIYNDWYGSYRYGVQRSTDNGASWELAALQNTPVHTLAFCDSCLYAGTDNGVFVSTDNGTNWSAANLGLTARSVTSVARCGSLIFVGTSQGVFRSRDSGSTWDAAGLSNHDVSSLLLDGKFLLAGFSVGAFDCIMYRSSDSGATWTGVDIDLSRSIDGFTACGVSAFGRNDTVLFAGVPDRGTIDGGVYESADQGVHWKRADAGLITSDVWSLAATGRTLLAGSDSGRVFLSTDGGAEWSPFSIMGTKSRVQSLAIVDTSFVASTESDGVFRSTNSGLSWEATNDGLTDSQITTGSLVVWDATLLAGTQGSGIYMSSDQGGHWESANSGLPESAYISALNVSEGDLVAAVENAGVWMRPLSQLITSSANSNATDLPLTFSLEQNYPNPFNPSTVIKYTVGGTRGWGLGVSDISLVVYDVLGRTVATLVNERKLPGTYEVMFDGSALASGVYFCRMVAGDFCQTRKLLLLK